MNLNRRDLSRKSAPIVKVPFDIPFFPGVWSQTYGAWGPDGQWIPMVQKWSKVYSDDLDHLAAFTVSRVRSFSSSITKKEWEYLWPIPN